MNQPKATYYFLPALFLTSVYFDAFLLFRDSLKLLLLSVIVSVLSGIANIILAFYCGRRGQKDFLLKTMAIMKYALIPFYLAVFLLGIAVTITTALFIGFFALVPWVALGIADFLVLFVTSSYSIAYLMLKGREKELTVGMCMLHGILQLLFITDVLDTMYLLSVHEKRYRVITLCTVLFICLLLFLFLR